MRIPVVLVASCLLSAVTHAQLPASQSPGRKLSLGFNTNIELLGFAYFVGFEGNNIETQSVTVDGRRMPEKVWQAYGYRFYQRYFSYAGSEHLGRALGALGDLWLSDIIPLLLQVESFPHAALAPQTPMDAYIAFSPKKDSAEARMHASIFLDACNAFYREVDFGGYLRASAGWYLQAQQQLMSHLPEDDFVGSMEYFYRKAHDRYMLIPSLTLPKGMAFGPRYRHAGESVVCNVFGAYAMQDLADSNRADMGFGDRTKLHELSVHEFGHSFVNPEVYALPAASIDSLEGLFPPIRSAMEAQGYNTWKSCMIEHLVRAGEVVISRMEGRQEAAVRLEKAYIQDRKFVYLPAVIDALERYREDSKKPYRETLLELLDRLQRR
jgi:hypothetical protein